MRMKVVASLVSALLIYFIIEQTVGIPYLSIDTDSINKLENDQSSVLMASAQSTNKERIFSDLPRNHWAYPSVEHALSKNIIVGMGDGTFHPDDVVTEEQFVKIALLTLRDGKPINSMSHHWSDNYYQNMKKMGMSTLAGYDSLNKRAREIDRGIAIQMVVEMVTKEAMTEHNAIDYAFQAGLTEGKYAGARTNTEKFAPRDSLTRAQSVVFMKRVRDSLSEKQINEALPDSAQSQDPLITNKEFDFRVDGIQLGESRNAVIQKLGNPKNSYLNEYGIKWEVFHKDWDNFVMIGFTNKQVSAVYTNQDIFNNKNEINIGTLKNDVRTKLGKPLEDITKGYTRYIIDSDEYDTYLLDDHYVTFFYDLHENNQLTAIQVVSSELEQSKNGFYANATEQLRTDFEHTVFAVTNALRVREQLPALEWSELAKQSSRLHSQDMAQHNFFSHTNLKGQSPFDRMEMQGIHFRSASENIAYGQFSAIFVHEGWMNSLGHRKNIVNPVYTLLGTGVAFSDNVPYYTQNFYSE